jgi:hypothetical protein
LTIESPFGTDGHVTPGPTITFIVGYAIGWARRSFRALCHRHDCGRLKQIFELEADWKKKKNYT